MSTSAYSFPLVDRSGVDDDPSLPQASGAGAAPRSAATPAPPPACEILVCQERSCLARGAEAVLTEIEELVTAGGDGGVVACAVRPSGCLGYCDAAPSAVVRRPGVGVVSAHIRIDALEDSAKVVESATGKAPTLGGAGGGRVAELREARARQHAATLSRWNTALCGLPEQVAQRPELGPELVALLAKAGFPGGVPRPGSPGTMPTTISNYSLWSLKANMPPTTRSADRWQLHVCVCVCVCVCVLA